MTVGFARHHAVFFSRHGETALPWRLICFTLLVVYTSSSVLGQDKWIESKDKFPLYMQDDQISCGPVCVSMVLGYFGKEAGIGPLKTKCGTRYLEAGKVKVGLTTPSGIKNGLQGYNAKADLKKNATFDDVIQSVDANQPPILLVRSGEQTWHYVVIIGYSKTGDKRTFQVADPANGMIRIIEEARIAKGWTYSGDYLGNDVNLDPDIPRKVVELAKIAGNTMIIPRR